MNMSLGLIVAGIFCVGACDVEHHWDDCDSEDDFEYEDDFETRHRAGSSSKAGNPSGSSGGTSGEAGCPSSCAGTGGTTDQPQPEPATPCDKERDCEAGFNCNFDVNECQPSDAETCGELETEAECADRADCIAVYGGINCSCGADCECQGGEPGCICESFDYLVCRAAQ